VKVLFGVKHIILALLTNPKELADRVNLATYTQGFQLTGPIAILIIYTIIYLGSFFGSYAIAIIVMTVLVRLLLLNLTIAQIKSMRLQQYIGPITQIIQQRYKHDRALQTQKLMLVNQKFGFNPLSGCLPIFVQLIVLFGVYHALYDPVFLGQTFWGIQLLFPINLLYARSFAKGVSLAPMIFDYIQSHNLWYQVLQWEIASGGKVYKWAIYWPALLLVVFYIGTSLFLQRVMRRATAPDPQVKEFFASYLKKKDDGKPDVAEQIQKQMSFMNIMLVFIAFIFSAGALLYFIVQNLLIVAEYTFIPRLVKVKYEPAELEAIIRAIEKESPTTAVAGAVSSHPSSVDPGKGSEEVEETEKFEILSTRKPFQKRK